MIKKVSIKIEKKKEELSNLQIRIPRSLHKRAQAMRKKHKFKWGQIIEQIVKDLEAQ